MPVVRKLTPEEVQTIEHKGKGPRKLIEEQYEIFLSEYDEGDYGEAVLDSEEKRLTVRNRFKAAAARRGLSLSFIRTNGDLLRFKVLPGNGRAAAPAPAPEPEPAPVASDTPPARRGGRKKKTA